MIIDAPMTITQGEPFAYDFTVTGQDWTGWTGTATFKRKPQAVTEGEKVEPILTLTATGDAAGLVQIGGTAADADLFPALPRLGFNRTAVCEISMTDGTDVKKYQVRVFVAAKV